MTQRYDNEILRRKFPVELQDMLDAELRLIQINAEAERWEACHLAIDRLRSEALLTRPWKLPITERLELCPEQLGLSVRVANQLTEAGYDTVDKILVAGAIRIVEIPNIGDKCLAELYDRLTKLFKREAHAGDKTGMFMRLCEWTAGFEVTEPDEPAGAA